MFNAFDQGEKGTNEETNLASRNFLNREIEHIQKPGSGPYLSSVQSLNNDSICSRNDDHNVVPTVTTLLERPTTEIIIGGN